MKKKKSLQVNGLFIILAVGLFCACSTPGPKAVKTPLKPTCEQLAKPQGLVCIEALIPYENAYEVRVVGGANSLHIPEATRVEEEDLIFLNRAFEEKLPVRLILKGNRILAIKPN